MCHAHEQRSYDLYYINGPCARVLVLKDVRLDLDSHCHADESSNASSSSNIQTRPICSAGHSR